MSIHVSTLVEPMQTVIKVDGRLKSEDLDELTKTVQAVHGRTALDLSDLQSADRAGLDLLRELIALGAEVRAASPYIELLLQTKP
jgi:ABC-type transporter Mla MlaB component